MTLAAGSIAVATAMVMLFEGDFTSKTQWTLSLFIIGTWLGCALAVRSMVVRPLQTLSNNNTQNTWTKSTYSLLAYKGQTVRVYFKATTDVSLPTSFFVDDVSLNVCH